MSFLSNPNSGGRGSYNITRKVGKGQKDKDFSEKNDMSKLPMIFQVKNLLMKYSSKNCIVSVYTSS